MCIRDRDCNDGSDLVSPSATEIDNNGIDDDCDGAVDTQVSDPDGDGYTAEAGDCDSTNAEVFPGANEVADGLDNDCDLSTDEGTAAGDDDGDGYCEGTDLDGVGGPDCGDGSQPGDCNDTVAAVNLNGNEVPNEQDDDCDGIVDEGSSGVDDDLDGFTEDAGDCDDENREVNPSTEEVEDEIDNDCDGKVDEGFSDLDGDGVTTEDGDCDDDNGWVNPGQREVCGDGIDNNCDGEVDEGCDPDAFVPAPGGCGCSTAPSTLGGLLGSLLVLPWLRRRRMT